MAFALLALANPARRITWNDRTAEDTEQLHGVTPNIGVLIIRIIGFRGPIRSPQVVLVIIEAPIVPTARNCHMQYSTMLLFV